MNKDLNKYYELVQKQEALLLKIVDCQLMEEYGFELLSDSQKEEIEEEYYETMEELREIYPQVKELKLMLNL